LRALAGSSPRRVGAGLLAQQQRQVLPHVAAVLFAVAIGVFVLWALAIRRVAVMK
jgi:hypothetical protein